uniref:Ubiquitin-like protease family profile domain-containing protein n=1 Tax=Anopheles culicifacies TaxID=139723 RepID=A0A182LRZ3_9DIPT
MKMFPATLISRLKSILTGGSNIGSTDSNDRKRKSVLRQDIDSKKRRMTTLSSIPAPAEEVGNRSNNPLLATANSVAGSIQLQNGTHGGVPRSMASARRLSDITDVPRVNHVYGSYSVPALGSMQRSVAADSRSSDTRSRFGTAEPRPLARRSGQAPPRLIPIKYVMSRPSIGQRSSGGSGTGPKPSAGREGLFRQSETPAANVCSGKVSTLTNEFRNLLRSKYSITPTSGSEYDAALDLELNAHRDATKKYESLMQKFIPILKESSERGAYDRFTRKTINGDISRPTLQNMSSIETLDLSDEGDGERESTSDDCVEVVSHSKSGRLFTPLDSMLTLAQEHEHEMKQLAAPDPPEPVNTVKERFETKQFYRDDIIQDVQQRYGTLFSQRKSLIEQEKDRLGALRKTTNVQENVARNKMLDYVCSFYKFDVLNEADLKESTPEPEVVPLPELTKEQIDQMHRKLRTGNQVVVEKFNLRITGNDLVTLQDLNWLNDAVINFYMELLRERSELKREQGLPKVYTMNTFFLPQLLKIGYSGVRRWTRKVDLLAHDMIVVPVHVGGIHWCMSMIDLRKKTIHYYDSMGSPNNAVLNALEEYLCEESMDKRKTPFDKSGLTKQNIRDCPRQKNGSDCGVFSCMFAEFLTRDHAITFDQSNMPYFRKKMTVEIMMGKLLT